MKQEVMNYEASAFEFHQKKKSHEEAKRLMGSEISNWRKGRKISIRDFAKMFGVSASFMYDVERGRRFPSEPIWLKIKNRLLKCSCKGPKDKCKECA